jgi:rhodanese-related sulfurtransferase
MLPDLIARAQAGLAAADPAAIDVTPDEAWDVLKTDPSAQLIDVRTPPEWAFVGVPRLSMLNKRLHTIAWRVFPSFEVNNGFLEQATAAISEKSAPIFFLCRTGGRSLDAAMALRNAGYSACFNIAGGFEGDLDSNGHRGVTSGWKAANLPWEQN